VITNSSILLQAYSTAKISRNSMEFLERFNEAIHASMDAQFAELNGRLREAGGNADGIVGVTEGLASLYKQRLEFDRAWQKTFAHHRGRYDDEHSAALTFHNNFNIEIGAS
jgi:hypothetical protein